MTISVLDKDGNPQTLDPPTQTTLAAILAKLSSDPATQTTLAAILAKLIAAPATEAKQDAIVTALGALATAANQSTANTTLATLLTAGTPITGQSLEAGGAGALGWFASIRKAITDRLGLLGQATMANSAPVVIASNQSAVPVSGTFSGTVTTTGNLGGYTATAAPTITVSTSPAYSAGDLVGGKLTLSSILRTSGGTALIQSLLLRDTSNQKAALELIIFDSDPSSTTFTDNAALSINAADVSKIIRRISIAAADYVTIGSIAVADVGPVSKVLKAATGVDLYACLMAATGSTPTYASTSALSLTVGVLQD